MDSRLSDITNPERIVPEGGSSELFMRLFGQLSNGTCVFEVTAERKIRALYLSDNYFKAVGYTKEQYLPYLDNITVTLPEEDEQRLIGKAQYSDSRDEPFETEIRGYRFDGSIGWFSVKAAPADFIKAEGKPFIAMVTDITERKQLERKANINYERYHFLEDNTDAVLFEYIHEKNRMVFSRGSKKADYVIENYSSYLRSSDRIFEDDRAFYYDRLLKLCEKAGEAELVVRSFDDELKDYILSRVAMRSISDEYGDVYSVVGKIERTDQGMKYAAEGVGENFDILRRSIRETKGKGSLLIFEIDNLSDLCSEYGEKTAENAVELSEAIIRQAAGDCYLFRLRDDRFVAWLDNINEIRLFEIQEKLQLAGETLTVTDENGNTVSARLSFSTGAAKSSDSDAKATLSDYVITAVNALYKAKQEEKDRICAMKITY